tara:strand:+ start:3661 stop:4821 length:1161 start_codon:yes stop_codon:yes gene_type:complete
MAGSFIAEQAKAMAELPNVNIAVSLWGQASLEINPRRVRSFLSFLKWCGQRKSFSERFEGLYEAYNPAVYWSHRLPLGGVKRLRGANLDNFNAVKDKLGGVDLIHAHVGYPAGCLAEHISERTGVPYVLTEHMGPFPFPSLLRRGRLIPELLSAYANASRVIAVSPAQAAMMKLYGISNPLVIPNFVDEREFDCALPQGEKFGFLTVCSVTVAKGVGDLLRAIALWRPSAGKVEFRIIGDGPDFHYFRSESERLGISDLVNWYGAVPRNQIATFFKGCHAFVMPSHCESFGMVYAEAIACGKPVIATKCGGPEFIVNGGNGVLVEVADVDSLCRALQDIHNNWTHFSASDIRRDFMKRFSRFAVSRSLMQVYEEVSHADTSLKREP